MGELAIAEQTASETTTESPPIDPIEQEVDSFLAGQSGAEVGGTGAEQSPPKEAELPELTAAKEAATAATVERVEREERERIRREEAEIRSRLEAENAHKQFLDEYANDVRRAIESARTRALRLGATEEEADEAARDVQTALNKRHQDGLKLYESEATQKARIEAEAGLGTALLGGVGEEIKAKILAEANTRAGKGEASYPFSEVARDIVVHAREGYVTKAEAEADKRLAILSYRRDLEQKGLIQGTHSGQAVTSSGLGGGSIDLSTKEKVRNAHANDKISSAQAKALLADPNLPDGY